MKRYFELFVILFFSLIFVSGQTGLGVPTPIPNNPWQTINPSNFQGRVVNLGDMNNDGRWEVLLNLASTVNVMDTIGVFDGLSGNLLRTFNV